MHKQEQVLSFGLVDSERCWLRCDGPEDYVTGHAKVSVILVHPSVAPTRDSAENRNNLPLDVYPILHFQGSMISVRYAKQRMSADECMSRFPIQGKDSHVEYSTGMGTSTIRPHLTRHKAIIYGRFRTRFFLSVVFIAIFCDDLTVGAPTIYWHQLVLTPCSSTRRSMLNMLPTRFEKHVGINAT